ncbi:MAG: inner membrane CreD family protein, partial [Xanthomonadales bacterium]|nr:inner membrane CreD family protein [Xanthomonadales bacterium]
KLRLHPFQYLLIGISLSAFYTLLLSLSEYIRFNFAYLIASGAVILSIAGYCSVVLQQRIRGINTGILFAVLFSFIYVMVKAQEASLLMGSISIWFILALIMYMTRKIDWYSVYTSSPRND